MVNFVNFFIQYIIPIYIFSCFILFLYFGFWKRKGIGDALRTWLPPALFTLLIAYVLYGKSNLIEEKFKIDTLADSCFQALEIGQGETECHELASFGAKDNYLKKYHANQVGRIFSRTSAIVVKIPVLRNDNGNLVEEKFENMNLKNVYDQMNHFYWGSRAKASYLLLGVNNKLISDYSSQVDWERILKRLIGLIKSDANFSVRIMAEVVYSQISGFPISILGQRGDDPFGFNSAVQHWEDNKESILKSLKSR